MQSRGLDPKNLDAILVSHEHNDHIQSVGVLARRFDLPVYINRKTAEAGSAKIGIIRHLCSFACGTAFNIDQFRIHPFSISHDAVDPAGFAISIKEKKIGIATDLGIATAMVKEHLKQCTALILEANHDPQMLINGPYPWHLKQRIKGRSGHLSNVDSRHLLQEVRHDGLRQVILAHLSENNNTREKAKSEVGPALHGSNVRLTVSSQYCTSKVLTI